MVVFAIGGVIGGVIIGAASYDDYSNHSDYSNYSNYSNYSDSAERARREKEAKRSSLQSEKSSIENLLNSCKSDNLDDYLSGSSFISSSATNLTSSSQLSEMNSYAVEKIHAEEQEAIAKKVKDIKNEIANIDNAIYELEKIKKNINK